MENSFWLQLAAQLFSIFVGIFSYKRKSVSVSGLAALIIISGLFIWMNELALLFVTFFMFASSSALTHYKKSSKTEFEKIVAKNGPRDYVQALSNLGVATALLLVFYFSPSESCVAAICGSIAAANADSWASEIGGLSKKTPVMITNFKPVSKGVSGGITGLGTLGGIAGSLFISHTAVLFLYLLSSFNGDYVKLFYSTFIAGIIGFIFDSYIGALFQALYQSESKEQISEGSRTDMYLIKGYSWMNNDRVNLLSTVAGALAALAVYLL